MLIGKAEPVSMRPLGHGAPSTKGGATVARRCATSGASRPPSHRVVSVLTGDFLAPYLLASVDQGFGMMRMLAACGVDYVTWGNHEADVDHRVVCRHAWEVTDDGIRALDASPRVRVHRQQQGRKRSRRRPRDRCAPSHSSSVLTSGLLQNKRKGRSAPA